MAILYRNDIESFLPIEYDVENDKMFSHFNPEDTEEYSKESMYEWDAAVLREDAFNAPSNIMAENEADYELIRNLLENQQKSPGFNLPRTLKYFLSQQHDLN
jgi:hypothetical protein